MQRRIERIETLVNQIGMQKEEKSLLGAKLNTQEMIIEKLRKVRDQQQSKIADELKRQRENEARENEARETEARENEARENEARENEAKEKKRLAEIKEEKDKLLLQKTNKTESIIPVPIISETVNETEDISALMEWAMNAISEKAEQEKDEKEQQKEKEEQEKVEKEQQKEQI